MKKRLLFVITGVSGAGKSQALKVFEDLGFSCVDNLPIALLEDFARNILQTHPPRHVALGLDIRGGREIGDLPRVLKRLEALGIVARVLFLEAADPVIIQRYSETRHRHPLGKKVTQAIREERARLLPVKEIADKVIDTSELTLNELKETLAGALQLKRTREMMLSLVSFGYKHGLPMDADIVMDVRFLPNPNYERKLKKLTGLDARVARHILGQPIARRFLRNYLKFLMGLLPSYIREGKSYLTLAVGCTGGRHRSVFTAHYLGQKLAEKGYTVREFHRDIHR